MYVRVQHDTMKKTNGLYMQIDIMKRDARHRTAEQNRTEQNIVVNAINGDAINRRNQ